MTNGPDTIGFRKDSLNPDVSWSNARLENALRSTVQNTYQKGNFDDLTVKRIRKATEEFHGLSEDFFKRHTYWNQKSKDVIRSEVDSSSQGPTPSQPISKSPTPHPSPETLQTSRSLQSAMHGKKRSSEGESRPKKRQKKDYMDRAMSKTGSEEPNLKRPTPQIEIDARASSSSLTPLANGELEDIDQTVAASKSEPYSNVDRTVDTESEMSTVLDEVPKPKRKRRSAGSEQLKSKQTGKSKANKKTEQIRCPDVEEIKRLQSWLVKCGIRKQWYRELDPYDTHKAKVRHLREMLADVGMIGRFSVERATQIREERELKADLEAVQAGSKMWGKAESEEETGRPRKRLAKGLQELDFLNDNDGEETD